MTETIPSPLAEASASSLDEIMSRRPPFGGGTLSAMVTELRRMRVKWEAGEAEKRSAPKKAKKAAGPSSIPLAAEDLFPVEPKCS